VKKKSRDEDNFYPKISSSEKRFFRGNNNCSSSASITLYAVLLREVVVINLLRPHDDSLNVLFEEEAEAKPKTPVGESLTFLFSCCE